MLGALPSRGAANVDTFNVLGIDAHTDADAGSYSYSDAADDNELWCSLVLVLVLILRCWTLTLRLLGWVAFASGSSHFHPACPFTQVNRFGYTSR